MWLLTVKLYIDGSLYNCKHYLVVFNHALNYYFLTKSGDMLPKVKLANPVIFGFSFNALHRILMQRKQMIHRCHRHDSEQFASFGWLLNYTETVIRGVAHHFGVAAERGIAQAAELLCDPEFYQTRKEKRKRWRQQMEEQQAKQKWDNMERRLCPTAEQIQHDIKWCEGQRAYHEDGVEKNRAALERLRGANPIRDRSEQGRYLRRHRARCCAA